MDSLFNFYKEVNMVFSYFAMIHTLLYIMMIATITILYRKYVKESLINTLLNYAVDKLMSENYETNGRVSVSAPITRESSPNVHRKISPIYRSQVHPVIYEY